MRPSRACVDVSQNATVLLVEHAMVPPCCWRAIHEVSSVLGTDHSETVDPVDASNSLIVLSDTTKRWLSDHRRPLLNNGVTFTGISTSTRPSLLSQTRMDSRVAVAIRLPCSEYFAAITQPSWSSVSTFLRAATSQMVAVYVCRADASDACTSRVESGEKSTARTWIFSL